MGQIIYTPQYLIDNQRFIRIANTKPAVSNIEYLRFGFGLNLRKIKNLPKIWANTKQGFFVKTITIYALFFATLKRRAGKISLE